MLPTLPNENRPITTTAKIIAEIVRCFKMLSNICIILSAKVKIKDKYDQIECKY